jgi:YidC/Oxa1 family membrane protein insertase
MNHISDFIRELLITTHALIPNWGVAIIVVSLGLRLFLFPFQWIAFKENRKLQAIQPALKKLLEKYRKTPEVFMRESSKLKKSVGVRSWVPLILLLIQAPVFMAIYQSIPSVPGLRSAGFLWIPSLATTDPTFLLPLLMVGLVFLQQSWQKQKPAIPVWLMPAVSFVFMASMPSALVIHSLVSMAIQMGGERVIDRML